MTSPHTGTTTTTTIASPPTPMAISPHMTPRRREGTDPLLEQALVSTDPESPEEYLQRVGMHGLIEALVQDALEERPTTITHFAEAWFRSRRGGRPQIGLPPGTPMSLGASMNNTGTVPPSHLLPHPANSATGMMHKPRDVATPTSPTQGLIATTSDPSWSSRGSNNGEAVKQGGQQASTLTSPKESPSHTGQTADPPATQATMTSTSNGVTLVAPVLELPAPSEKSPNFTGGKPAMPKVPSPAKETKARETRPAKRLLKGIFPAPPKDTVLAFDNTVPPREGHYGSVRRALWNGVMPVAVKQVPVEAHWTLDEFHHLQHCQLLAEDEKALSGSNHSAGLGGSNNTAKPAGASLSTSAATRTALLEEEGSGDHASSTPGGMTSSETSPMMQGTNAPPSSSAYNLAGEVMQGFPAWPGLAPRLHEKHEGQWDVVNCYGAFYDPKEDKLWYVFEWVDYTLADLVTARRAALGLRSPTDQLLLNPSQRISMETEAAYIVKNLLHALSQVHGNGNRVHLDIKPANVLIRRRKRRASMSTAAPSRGSNDGILSGPIEHDVSDANIEDGSLSPPRASATLVGGGAALNQNAATPQSHGRAERFRSDVAKARAASVDRCVAEEGKQGEPAGKNGAPLTVPARRPAAAKGPPDVDSEDDIVESELERVKMGEYAVVLADFGTAQELKGNLVQLGDFQYMPPEVFYEADVSEDEGGVMSLPAPAAGAPPAATGVDASGASPAAHFVSNGPHNVFRESNDVWSVGCLLIYMIEGCSPYDCEPDDVFHVLRSCWMSPTLQHPQLWSPEINSFLGLCFERDARLRPTAEALLTHPWIEGVASAPTSPKDRKVVQCNANGAS